VVIYRGEIRWASLPSPLRSEPGFRRPVLIVQANAFNLSQIRTVIAAVITSNVRLGDAPGNVLLDQQESGLSRQSVVNVSQVVTIDKEYLGERVSSLSVKTMRRVDAGMKLTMGL
jgi:mRNA interferase MazF